MAVANIPGAFIHTDTVHGNRIVRARVCVILADLLVKIESAKFVDNFFLEGGQKVIYAALNKSLCGDLIVSLLFWKDLSGALGCWRFEMNLYDSCIMNKSLDGKQCTICWHVDDLNISHVSLKVVDGVISQLTTKYGKISELSLSQGRVHDYLGVSLDYDTKGKVRINMPKHI